MRKTDKRVYVAKDLSQKSVEQVRTALKAGASLDLSWIRFDFETTSEQGFQLLAQTFYVHPDGDPRPLSNCLISTDSAVHERSQTSWGRWLYSVDHCDPLEQDGDTATFKSQGFDATFGTDFQDRSFAYFEYSIDPYDLRILFRHPRDSEPWNIPKAKPLKEGSLPSVVAPIAGKFISTGDRELDKLLRRMH